MVDKIGMNENGLKWNYFTDVFLCDHVVSRITYHVEMNTTCTLIEITMLMEMSNE